MLLQIFVIAFATFYALSAVAQVVDLENHGFVIRIDDRAFMRMVIDEAILARELLIVFTSRNDNIDAYGKLYVGWLQHLFTSLRFNTRLCTLVLDMSLSRGQISANFDYFLSILPEESVFVVCDHGPADMDIRALNYVTTAKERSNPRTNDTISLQHYRPVADFAIFHLNHEQPWNFNAGTWNVRYSSKKHLFETSSAHRLLFRNYFYSPLSKAAGVLQLPLGPAYYGFKGPYFGPQLQLQTSPSSLRTTTPISQRPVKCRFIGRQTYGKDNQEFVPERDDFMVLAHQLTFSEVVQVNATHIIGWKDGTDNDKKHDTITGSASFPCDAVDSLDYSRLVGYLEAYTLSLTLTRFVPCPPGNNPETFRHYEALEAGAIPLILRGLVHSEFLTSSYWAGYPGPLFTNWQDAGRFVQTISDEEADVLQIVVQEWYVGMKQSMQQVVEGVVLQHFPFVAKNKDAGFGSDSGPGHYLDVDTHSTSALVSNITEQEMYCPDHSCVVSAVTLGHHGTFQLVLHRGHRPEDAVSDFLRDHSAEFTTSGLEDVRKVILIQLCQQIGALGPQDVLSACDGEPEREVLVSMLIAGWHNEYLCLRRGYGLTHYVTMLCAWWGCTEQRQMYIKQLYIAQTIYQLLLENNPAIADPALMDSVVVQKGDMQALFGDLLYPLTNYAYQKSSVRVDITLGVGWGDGEREVVISVVVLQGQHPEDAVGDLLMQKSTLRLLGLGPEVESGSSSSARAHVEVVYREIMDVLCPHLAVSAPHIIQCRGIYHSENEDGGSDEVGDGRSAVLYTLNISKTDMDMDDGADIGADHVHLHSAQELLPLVHVRKGYSVDFYVYLVCMQLRCNMEKQRQVEAALRRLSLVPWINNSRSMLADGECVSCSVGDACISRRQRQSRRLGDSEATVARVMVTFGGQHGANLRYSFGSGTNPRHGETETVTALLKVFTVMRPEDAVADFLLQHGLDDPDCYMMSKSEPQSSAEIEIGHFTGTRGRCINAEEQRVEIMRQLCPTVHKLRSMTLPLRECSEQNGQGGLYSIGRRIFTSVNLSSLLPPECQECPLVHVRTGYTLVELRGWVGDQVCCRGDGGDPRSYLSPEVITALEVAVMGAVWNILKDREKLLVHIKDYSEEDLVLLGRLYDSTVLGKQSYPYLQAREEEGAVGNAPIGAKSGALMRRTARNDTYKRYGLHPRCLIPLTEENVGANKVQARTAIYAVLCRNSVVVLYTSILVLAYEHGSSPIGAPTRSSQTEETEQTGPLPMSERNWIPFVLYSEQRLADAAADFLFEHQRRLLDKETVFQDILDQLCPLLADAKIAVQHTGKRVSLCDSDAASGLNGDLNDNDGGSSTSVKGSNIGVNGKSPLVVSIDLSHALPFPVPIYPWLHMRTLYTLEFYTAMVCTQLQCDALKELIVGAAVKKEYLRAMELRDVRGRYCDLSTRVELLGQKTQLSHVDYKKFRIDLSNNFVLLFATPYRRIAAQVCMHFQNAHQDPPEVCIPEVAKSLARELDGPPLEQDAYAFEVNRYQPAVRRNKVAFITAIYGDYDTACQVHSPQAPLDADFICFSDNPEITANHWEVDSTPYHILFPSALDNGAPDLINSLHSSINGNNHTFNIAKYYKQAFYNIPRLQNYDIVVWMDGSLQLTEARAAEQVSLTVEKDQCAVGVWNHTIRRHLSEEVQVTKDFYRYCSTYFNNQHQPYQNISGQYHAYMQTHPEVEQIGVWYTTFMVYNMKSPLTRYLLDNWYLETLRHTTNDQISFPYAVLTTSAADDGMSTGAIGDDSFSGSPGMIDSLCTFPNALIRGQYPNHQTSLYIKHDHTIPL